MAFDAAAIAEGILALVLVFLIIGVVIVIALNNWYTTSGGLSTDVPVALAQLVGLIPYLFVFAIILAIFAFVRLARGSK